MNKAYTDQIITRLGLKPADFNSTTDQMVRLYQAIEEMERRNRRAVKNLRAELRAAKRVMAEAEAQ